MLEFSIIGKSERALRSCGYCRCVRCTRRITRRYCYFTAMRASAALGRCIITLVAGVAVRAQPRAPRGIPLSSARDDTLDQLLTLSLSLAGRGAPRAAADGSPARGQTPNPRRALQQHRFPRQVCGSSVPFHVRHGHDQTLAHSFVHVVQLCNAGYTNEHTWVLMCVRPGVLTDVQVQATCTCVCAELF